MRAMPAMAAIAVSLFPLPGQLALADTRKSAPIVEAATDISFGMVAATSSGGTITLTPSGVMRCSAGLQCLGGERTGLFYVTGPKDYMVGILLTPAQLTTARGDAMLAIPKASQSTMVLNPGKRKNQFSVGGTLTLSAAQPEGAYIGSYEVMVEYF
ncbi:hypothetical protein EBBID32_22160 [Sphingobium indicum BiD32]|uniref:DUF4402 domain-containing protein n=1 Tax=Sphingobium indicum BiD32 TaxID=1301087 RepID=N1MQD1_9SPHN|nr:DUF4402 domain-containing protein [Sphingobium indicum]CCW17867.1 hypothetical protein EBBID32_22160 [Sphingobium indicum BiD32]